MSQDIPAADEKRSYSRVATKIQGYARLVSSGNALSMFQNTAALNAQEPPEALRNSHLPDSVVEFMVGMNAKLDMLLSMLSQRQMVADFPMEIIVTDISGAGCRFICDAELVSGQYAELVLILSQMPLQLAGAIGTITRATDAEEGTEYAMTFTSIRDTDLEAVIQFVFQEQRSRIRTEKWS